MSTPTVTPAQGPVQTTGDPVPGQMYYIPDDLFVIVQAPVGGGRNSAVVHHPMCGAIIVPCHTLREVRYV